jgi:hypothetical protein
MDSLRQSNPDAPLIDHHIWPQSPLTHTEFTCMDPSSASFSNPSPSGSSLEATSSASNLRALAGIATRPYDSSISSSPNVARNGSISVENEALEKMNTASLQNCHRKKPKFTWIFRPPDPNLNAKTPRVDRTLDHYQILGLGAATIDALYVVSGMIGLR